MKRINIMLIGLTLLLTSCGKENKKTVNTTEISIVREKQVARFSMEGKPKTLDLRFANDSKSINMIQLSYEGLTRMQDAGRITPGVAKRISVSEDGLMYTFYLHETTWSNKDPITSKDFELTWKSILSDTIESPHKHLFFVIKNAKKISEKKVSIDELGVRCIDDKTLEVSLEHPCVYFPNLVSCHPFFPLHNTMLESKKNSENISNGPFTIEENQDSLILKKNTHYIDKHKILLDEVHFIFAQNDTAVKMFENKELDWVGFPCSNISFETIQNSNLRNCLRSCQLAKVYYLQLNCENRFFKNINLRRAFASAIDKKSLGIDLLHPLFQTNDSEFSALDITTYGQESQEKLFERALSELGIAQSDLQGLTLLYCTEDPLFKEIAEKIQKNYKQVFSIDLQVIPYSFQEYRKKLEENDFCLLVSSVSCEFFDQSCFLEAIGKIPGWHNDTYANLLSQADVETDTGKRVDILEHAHKILLEEIPVLPLFQGTYTYLKNDGLKNAKVTPLGFLDLRYAHMEWKL